MQSIETDDILFNILNTCTELREELKGGIYVQGERPDDSREEDIAINNLYLNHEYPQSGLSNVNIYVPDMKVMINGNEQRKANRERLRTLTSIAVQALRNANIEGLAIRIANETVIKEPEVSEHCTNLRIEWNILRTN